MVLQNAIKITLPRQSLECKVSWREYNKKTINNTHLLRIVYPSKRSREALYEQKEKIHRLKLNYDFMVYKDTRRLSAKSWE